MGLVFFQNSDIATNLSLESGFQVARNPLGVRIYAPRTVYISRFPVLVTFHADVKPSSHGFIFNWKLLSNNYVTTKPQLTVQLFYPPGTYELELEAWNAFGSVRSSMVFEVATTLLLLNYSLSNFFTQQNGSISLEINQSLPPDTFYLDFGDDTAVYDSNTNSSVVLHHYPSNHSSVLTVYHSYEHPGLYDVYLNVTNSVSGFEQWISIVVEERISGVELFLLSPPIVELLEEITVMCLVERGTNLVFNWDFGDGSDGEQYTRQDTHQLDRFKFNNTAYHSYGIANSYNVCLQVSNTYESVTVHLNTTIQAVERIVQLQLLPDFRFRIKQQYAAPLYRKKNADGTDSTSMYLTSPIEFEAVVWRGSDVQFSFDFGDGTVKYPSSLLSAFSLPHATVKHSYDSEGIYNVSVTATNLLSSVKTSLKKPFYVQFPPENLQLDKQYYILKSNANVTLQASTTQGTNVSYHWRIGDMDLIDTGSTLFLPMLNPGIYLVTVEAFNQVTDHGYNAVRRPNTTAKIYVQEILLGISICVKTNMTEVCDAGVLDLPLDEEVEFRVKVYPSTETVLRFVWQIGIQEIRRTSVPYFRHRYQQAGWYSINVTAQNHISSISSEHLQLYLIQKVANLTSIFCQGPNLVNHLITYRALYWFGTNLTFQWDFGDGSDPLITTSSSVQHTYREIGEYWVTVNVWNKFSHANITTNMFFLHHMCQKPEIMFLHQRNRIAKYGEDILVEADIAIICKTTNVGYIWTVKENNTIIDFGSSDILYQRELVIPQFFLQPGSYSILLRVNMIGTIVYAESSTSLEIVPPNPVIYIKGGFMHWIGIHDSREMVASVLNFGNQAQPLSYGWSCVPLIQRHLPCFKDPEYLSTNLSPKLRVSTTALTPNLGAVIVNVTLQNDKLLSASQLLEIKHTPHMLHVDIECEDCHDHHVNQQNKIQMKSVCKNCGDSGLEYHWKVWIIEDGRFNIHFGNYECVQADGSTFFIMAPNATDDDNSLNSTYLPKRDFTATVINRTDEHMLAEKPYEAINEDLPPFPSLPGFPEENSTTSVPKLSRSVRDIFDEEIFESSDLIPDYPYEGDADYEDNSTYKDFPYPDFLPFPAPDVSFEGPDYLITEEGLPGEGGSAAARHQSSQNLDVLLSEDEDQILEGAGKPRMKPSGNNNVLIHNSHEVFDPLRDRLNRKYPAPHIVNRPRGLLFLSENDTTSGFSSEYLILKPGILKVGRSYLVQAKVVNKDDHLEGIAMEYFKVNVGPINGRCTLMPMDGYSINFDFRLHCLEWKSDHLPLYYELSYSRDSREYGHLIYSGLNANIKFNLPSGLESENFNIFLNVVVRDSFGVTTKVCSIVRKVSPLQVNTSYENVIHNETFHPRAALNKLVGEKNNQAVLQKLHVLAVSLNNYEPAPFHDYNAIKSKIRQGFFEVMNDLRVISKVEVAQLISVLNEIIDDVNTIKQFELQKAYNLYKRMHHRQSELYDFFASSHMHSKFLVFLSKLAFAAYTTDPQSEELIAVIREEIKQKMIDFLKNQLEIEEPLQIHIPHLSVAALCVTEQRLLSKPKILLKTAAVEFLDNTQFISEVLNNHNKMCNNDDPGSHHGCLKFVAQENDYVPSPSNLKLIDFEYSKASSVFLSLISCNSTIDRETVSLNISVQFTRPLDINNTDKVLLKRKWMNVHAINISQNHIYQSLLFYAKFDDLNTTEYDAGIDIMFRYRYHPTLKSYDLKMSFPPGVTEMNLLISPSKIKVPGVYYFSVLSRSFQETKNDIEHIGVYEASVWKDVCFGKEGAFWSANNCYVMETTNCNWTQCRCFSKEVTASSTSLKWELYLVSVNDLIDPYFNPLPLFTFLVLLILFIILVYLNYKKDKSRNLTCSPIPLQDNDSKHKQFYLICVRTGLYFSSGTTASVFIVLHGSKDVTETRQLVGSEAKRFCFQRGSVDVFLLSTSKNLGTLLKLEVWHNNQGVSPSWYLQSISIKDLHTDASYRFDCYNWLSVESGDGQIERELSVAENTYQFKKVLYENLISYMNDLNMWNALVCDSPTSFFSGPQRVLCCLCYFLNCAFLLVTVTVSNEVLDDSSLPHITSRTLLQSLIASLVASVPQIIYTALFRFSNQPSLEVNPKFRDIFHWLYPYRFNCLLTHKRSTSSRSTDRSPSSMEGSDSLYSSFEDSSIMSVPDVLEGDSLSSDIEEKEGLPLSFSFTDLSDPVSPLQKTLSTWQTLENWLIKKQSLILKPDTMLMKRHIYVPRSSSTNLGESINIDQYDSRDGSSHPWESNMSLSRDSNSDEVDSSSVICNNIECLNKDLELNFFFPCLHSVYYYFNWLILLCNMVGTSLFTLIESSRYSIPSCILLFKKIMICGLFSCLGITPLLILVISVFCSIIFYSKERKQTFPDAMDSPLKEKKPKKIDYNSSCYRRIEYFKKYLRPPKEQILEQFRRVAIQEKQIRSFFSGFWKYAVVFIFLFAATYPMDIHTKYLQRSSVQNVLFRSLSISTKQLPSKHSLLSWLEMDFLDGFLIDHLCVDVDEDCRMSTGSILVGNIILRNFYVPQHFNSQSEFNSTSSDFGNMYERRLLKGYYSSYLEENEWQVLTDQKFYFYDEMHDFLEKLNSSSAASIEFLLFNPVIPMFTSVSLLFESMPSGGIKLTHEILPVVIPSDKSFHHYLKILFNLIFLVFILFNCRNILWKTVKHKSSYWGQKKNYFSCSFIIVYFIYLTFFTLYIITCQDVMLKLVDSGLSRNVDITKIPVLELYINFLVGVLVFIHVVESCSLFYFHRRLKKLLKRLVNSQRKLFIMFLIFIVTILVSVFMTRNFLNSSVKFSHPLFGFIKVINSLFSTSTSFEVSDGGTMFKESFAIFTSLILIIIHIYLFSFIKSVLMNHKNAEAGFKNRGITFKMTAEIVKKKFLSNFKPGKPQLVSHSEYAPPVDFLLFELERLADALVSKANSLFPDQEDIDSFLNEEWEMPKPKVELEEEILSATLKTYQVDIEDELDCELQERLIATIPRRNKMSLKAFMPSSFHASLGSEKKFTTFDSQAVLQPNRIRKTYPLSHLDSESTSSKTDSEPDPKVDSANNLTIRKTQSRGKGKKEDFDLSVGNSNHES